MTDTTVTAFLGDRDRRFDLLFQLAELERILAAPTGVILKRIMGGDYHVADLAAVVRLGLIGAGETPQEAAALVATYITARPLTEGQALATTIALAAWAGAARPAEPAPAPKGFFPTAYPVPAPVEPEPFPDGHWVQTDHSLEFVEDAPNLVIIHAGEALDLAPGAEGHVVVSAS